MMVDGQGLQDFRAAFNAGSEAAEQGITPDAVFYPVGTAERFAWLSGFAAYPTVTSPRNFIALDN